MSEEGTTYTQEDFEAALEKEREKLVANRDRALDQYKDQKRKYDELSDEHQSLLERIDSLEQAAKAKDAGVPDEKLAEIREQIEAAAARKWSGVKDERDTLKGQLEEALGTVRSLQLDNVVKGEMAKAGVRAERIDALFKLVGDRFDLADDGEVVATAQPDVPIVKYIGTEVATEFPELFNGSGSSGGGASRSAGGAGGQPRFIAAGDKQAFMANIEGLATGAVEVRE